MHANTSLYWLINTFDVSMKVKIFKYKIYKIIKVLQIESSAKAAISADSSNYPYLAMSFSSLGHIGMYVVVERRLVGYSKNVLEAVFALIAVYYCFDMVYPVTFNALLMFVAEILMEVFDKSQRLPSIVTRVLGSITSIQSRRNDQ